MHGSAESRTTYQHVHIYFGIPRGHGHVSFMECFLNKGCVSLQLHFPETRGDLGLHVCWYLHLSWKDGHQRTRALMRYNCEDIFIHNSIARFSIQGIGCAAAETQWQSSTLSVLELHPRDI